MRLTENRRIYLFSVKSFLNVYIHEIKLVCNFSKIGLLQSDFQPSKLMLYTLNFFLLCLNVSTFD